MAIVGGGDDEDLNNPANNAAGGGSGGYAGEGSGQGATTQPGGSPTPTSSGNYSNLSSYLQANQGAGATTGKAAENVVDQAGNASNAANSTLASNGAKEPQGAVVDQGVLGAIKGGVGSGVGGKTIATGQEGGVASAYKGPDDATGVTGYGDAAKAMDTLGGDLQNANGSMTGNSALLRQAYQQPQYSQGENNLDSFLVGGSAGQQATADWKPQGASYQGVLDKINGGIQSAKDQTGQVQNVYDTAKAGANAQTAQNNAMWSVKDAGDRANAKAAADKAAAQQAAYKAAGAVSKNPPMIAKTNIPNSAPKGPAPIYQGFAPPPTAPAPPPPSNNTGGDSPIIDPSGTTVGQTNNPIINHGVGVMKKKFGLAHGGEIPNYDQLLKMLRTCS